jgi:small subunit ribosomal protein S16
LLITYERSKFELMATRIRLARHGSKKRPYYRIVVTNSRTPSDRRSLDQIGVYDPSDKTPLRIEADKLHQWLKKGATPTLTVAQLIKRSGIDRASPAEAAEAPAATSGEG